MTTTEALKEIMDRLGQVLTLTERTATRVEKLEDSVEKLDKTIRGYNSNPGLVTRIAVMEDSFTGDINRLEKCVDELECEVEGMKKEREARLQTSYRYMITTIVGMVVSIIVAVGMLLLTQVISP